MHIMPSRSMQLHVPYWSTDIINQVDFSAMQNGSSKGRAHEEHKYTRDGA